MGKIQIEITWSLELIIHSTENTKIPYYSIFVVQIWRKGNPETQWMPGARGRNSNWSYTRN